MPPPVTGRDDIVPTDDITGSASVFVFRGSSKKPQATAGGGRAYRPASSSVNSNRARVSGRVNTTRANRRATAKERSAAIAKARARERNARLRRSVELAAQGENELAQGSTDRAIASFRESLTLNPKNTDASSGLSDALTAQAIEMRANGNGTAAGEMFIEAVSLKDDNALAYAQLGEIFEDSGETVKVIENYERALGADPEFSALYLPLGFAYLSNGNPDKAEEFLVRAEAAGIISTESSLARALIAHQRGSHDSALLLLDRVVESEPNNAEAHFRRAVVQEALDLEEPALASYQAAVKADPAHAAAWFDLGVIYYNRGQYENARLAYTEVIKHDPENARAHANLASVYRQEMRYAEANVQYRAANEKGISKDPDLYSEWGYCLGKTEEWDKASARLETAKELSPTAIDHNNLGWAHYNTGRADAKVEKTDEANAKFALARAELQQAVTMDAAFYPAYVNLGSTNNALGDFAAAITALNQALRYRNDWVIALNQLGLAFRGSNDYKAAIQQFVRVTTLENNNVFGLYNLGELYHITGNKRDARRIQQRLNAVDPTMARQLDDVLSGKVVLDELKKKIPSRIPSIRRFPF